MSCGYCCPLCPTGCQYSGKIRFIEPQGLNDPCSDTPRESLAKFRDWTVWEGPVGSGPVGQYSG